MSVAKDLERVIKDAGEPKLVPRPTIVTKDFVAEETWNRTGYPVYHVWHFSKQEFTVEEQINFGEVDRKSRPKVYLPADNDSLRKGLVTVTTEPVKSTFPEVFARADKFLLDNFDPCGQVAMAKLLTRVAMASCFLDKFAEDNVWNIAGMGKFAPIIAIRGPAGSGKNRFANVLRFLSYRPFFEMSTYRIPSLYRPLDLWLGSLFLDEMDLANTSERSELIHFLNCRATGTPLSRQDPNNPKVTHAFSSFGLTVVTQRRIFEDNATESRCLPFYSEATDKRLPTVETDEMIREGMELQNRLLYLRMTNFDKIRIEKKVWFEEVTDARLNAALLPLIALSAHEPSISGVLRETVGVVERLKIEQKAASDDGQLVNLFWEKIDEGLFESWNNPHYYLLESRRLEDKDGREIEHTAPLTTKLIAEDLKMSPKRIRQVILSLNIAAKELTSFVRIGTKSHRVIFFSPERLERRLREFVVSYEPNSLLKKLGQSHVTDVTHVTLLTHGTSESHVSKPDTEGSPTARRNCDKCDNRDSTYTQEVHERIVGWIMHNHREGMVPAEPLASFLQSLSLNPDKVIQRLLADGLLYKPGDGYLHWRRT